MHRLPEEVARAEDVHPHHGLGELGLARARARRRARGGRTATARAAARRCPERGPERARDAGDRAHRRDQPRRLGGVGDDAVELLVEDDLVVDRLARRRARPRRTARAAAPAPRGAMRVAARAAACGSIERAHLVEVEQVGGVERAHDRRRGGAAISTRPSRSSSISASRTGVREVPKRSASASARRRSPGASSPSRIASRSASRTPDRARRRVAICIQNHAGASRAPVASIRRREDARSGHAGDGLRRRPPRRAPERGDEPRARGARGAVRPARRRRRAARRGRELRAPEARAADGRRRGGHGRDRPTAPARSTPASC